MSGPETNKQNGNKEAPKQSAESKKKQIFAELKALFLEVEETRKKNVEMKPGDTRIKKKSSQEIHLPKRYLEAPDSLPETEIEPVILPRQERSDDAPAETEVESGSTKKKDIPIPETKGDIQIPEKETTPEPEPKVESIEAVHTQIVSDMETIKQIINNSPAKEQFSLDYTYDDAPASLPLREALHQAYREYATKVRNTVESLQTIHRMHAEIMAKAENASFRLEAPPLLYAAVQNAVYFRQGFPVTADNLRYGSTIETNTIDEARVRLEVLAEAMKRPAISTAEALKTFMPTVKATLDRAEQEMQSIRTIPKDRLQRMIDRLGIYEEQLRFLWIDTDSPSLDSITNEWKRVNGIIDACQNEQTRRSNEEYKQTTQKEKAKKTDNPAEIEVKLKSSIDLLEKANYALQALQNLSENASADQIESAIDAFQAPIRECSDNLHNISWEKEQRAYDLYVQKQKLQARFENDVHIDRLWKGLPQKKLQMKKQELLSRQLYVRSDFAPEKLKNVTTQKLDRQYQVLRSSMKWTKEGMETFAKEASAVTNLTSVIRSQEIQDAVFRSRISKVGSRMSGALDMQKNDPETFNALIRYGDIAAKTVASDLSGKQYLVHIEPYSNYRGPAVEVVVEETSNTDERAFLLQFKGAGKNLTLIQRSHHARVSETPQPASDNVVRSYVRGEMNVAPRTLVQNAGKLGISQDEVKLLALQKNITGLDYFSNMTADQAATRFGRAPAILAQINGQAKIPTKTSFKRLDALNHSDLERLLTTTEMEYAEHMIAALGDGTMNVGYANPDTSKHRFYVDLHADHGIMLRVNERLRSVLARKQLTWPEMRTLIRAEWNAARAAQWESFSKSEEIVDGKPKIVHYLSICTREFKTEEAHTYMAEQINQHLYPKGTKDVPKGKGYQIVSDDYRDTASFLGAIRETVRKIKAEGAHLVVGLHAHGSDSQPGKAGQMYFTFNNVPEELATPLYSSQILSVVDAEHPSKSAYVGTCHGGSHLKEFKRDGRYGYVPKNVMGFTDNKVMYGGVEGHVGNAFYPQENDTYAGDINGDGIVTQAEIREYLNSFEIERDPIIYDNRGNQIGALSDDHVEGLA